MLARLAVSGVEVEIHPPGGNEDLLLAESSVVDVGLAIAFAGATTRSADGAAVDWAALPHTDLDVAVVLARTLVFGDVIRATATCPTSDCGSKISVAFSLREYLDHHRPGRARGVEPDASPGWFRITGQAIRFRVPTAGDLSAARTAARPDEVLMAACVEPTNLPAARRSRVERALERLAPTLVDEVAGTCPECGSSITMWFDPVSYCLRELRDQAAGIYDDIHVLASAYHWSEERILALPRARRVRYADMVRDERRSA
jgi:hypothetical protein